MESIVSSDWKIDVPESVRAALGLKAGDTIVYRIEAECVWMTKAGGPVHRLGVPFATFTEWNDELDSVFDDL